MNVTVHVTISGDLAAVAKLLSSLAGTPSPCVVETEVGDVALTKTELVDGASEPPRAVDAPVIKTTPKKKKKKPAAPKQETTTPTAKQMLAAVRANLDKIPMDALSAKLKELGIAAFARATPAELTKVNQWMASQEVYP